MELLASDGFLITQATLSRDFIELGAQKVRNENGALVYSVLESNAKPAASESELAVLSRLSSELLLTAAGALNQCLLRTPPGAAQFLASAIDSAKLDGVIGTIAGDDTVLIIGSTANAGNELTDFFVGLSSNEF